MAKPIVRTKPHHFLDIIAALGEGITSYEPHAYGHAVHSVAAKLLADPGTEIELVIGADDICAPCRHNAGGACNDTIDISFRPKAPRSKGHWNRRIDERWFERLGLKEGDRMAASAFCRAALDRMGDITDIYREEPAERTAAREAKLRKGLALYLRSDAK